MKKFIVTFFLLAIISMMHAQIVWDFKQANPDGDTLYYTITSPTTVAVACPHDLSTIPFIGPNEYQLEFNFCYDFDSLVTIPGSVTYNGTTYTVNEIGEKAFCMQQNIREVILPEEVEVLNVYSFDRCKLKTITMPAVRILKAYCFEWADLSHVNLPNTLTEIEWGAFWGSKLERIEIPGSVRALRDCTFFYCIDLRELKLNEGLDTIETEVIGGNILRIDSLVIPSTVRYFGRIMSTITTYARGVKYVEFKNDPQHPERVLQLEEDAFLGLDSIETVILSNHIRELPRYAFQSCRCSIKNVFFSDSLKTIDDYNFADCTQLEQVTIPASVQSIGYKVLSSRAGSFSKVVTMEGEVPPVLGDRALCVLNSNGSISSDPVRINIPCGTTNVYQSAEGWNCSSFQFHEECVGLDEYEPESVVSLYPVPANSWLHIRSTEQDIHTVELWDMMGHCVLMQSVGGGDGCVELSQLRAGLYMARITFSDGTVTSRKFVKE